MIGEPTNDAKPPFPIVVGILQLIDRMSTDWSLTELVYRRYFDGVRSAFVECLVVARFGLLVTLLFLAFRPIRYYHVHGWQPLDYILSFTLTAFCLYTLVETVSILLRLQLLHRTLRFPPYDAARSFILAFVNVIEAIILFAAVYQLNFYLSPADARPLMGSSLQKHPVTKEVFLYPFDALYFSFVTITTLGYGDIHPATTLYRLFAFVESLAGILLIVVLFAFAMRLFPAMSHATVKDTYYESQYRIRDYLARIKKREHELRLHHPELATKLRILKCLAVAGLTCGACSIIIELLIETWIDT